MTRYMFTWNNYPDDWHKRLTSIQHILAGWVGKEKAPSTGTLHLQGFLKFSKSVRITAILKAMNMKGGIWMQVARAADQVCINYCSKGNQSHDEWVQLRHMGPMWGAGAEVVTFGDDKIVSKMKTKKPSQVEQFKAAVHAGSVKTIGDLEEMFSDLHASSKGPWCENYLKKHTKIKHIFHPEDIPNSKWQMYIRNIVSVPIMDLLLHPDRSVREQHRRTVYFVVDLKGNGGKTKLTKWLHQEMANVVLLDTGKIADMKHSLATERDIQNAQVVIIDATRQSQGTFQYNVIENVKNGVIRSPKYQGGWMHIHPPHVIVMTNQVPVFTDEVLSVDRPEFIMLDRDDPANGEFEILNKSNGFGYSDEIGKDKDFDFTFLREAKEAARGRKKLTKWLHGDGNDDDF